MIHHHEHQHARRKINWTLITGVIVVIFMVLMMVIGPWIATHDPMQENYTLGSKGHIHTPPYRILEVPGYPLGTDNFGRDLLSRLLYGIRPTMSMVMLVASVRLILALTIGTTAGWSRRLTGRVLDNLISIGLALPVLIVALVCISAVGSQHGLWVFVIGLSMNGWAEAAQLIRNKTHEIRDLAYVEASRAMGASTLRILITRILRQILPMVWMLMAYEISATLLVTAELGFLGYYIGGGVWIEILDFQAVNTTSLPELGQILATSIKNLTDPTILIVTGSTIFIIILGFNLLGDGLRREITIYHTGRLIHNPLLERITLWFEWRLFPTIENLLKRKAIRYTLIALVIILIAVISWWRFAPRSLQVGSMNEANPGNHPWVAERGNAQATRFVNFEGPAQGTVLWHLHPVDSFNGGPVVAENGTIYIAGVPDALFALDKQGNILWQAQLEGMPVGTPALGAMGQIYVVDEHGGLSAFDPDGTLLWRYNPTNGRAATSGPVVSRGGVIYYRRLDAIQAVSSSGESLWYTRNDDVVVDTPPFLNPVEDLVLTKGEIILSESGSRLNVELFNQLDPVNFYTDPTFFSGANGKLYYRIGHGAFQWDLVNNQFVIGEKLAWDPRNPELAFPFAAGVNGHNLLWLLYGNYYRLDEIAWLDVNGGSVFGTNDFTYYSSNLIGMDINDISYLCGYVGPPRCLAFKPGQVEAIWEVSFPEGEADLYAMVFQIWGALAPGRLYVTTIDGHLYAVGSGIVDPP